MCLSPKVVPASRKFMDVKMPSVSGNQSKEVCTSGDEQALKVRKPYTITKQREKWTDEEHKKFLEALKLHGRAWRRIEEHVGTKTAVQIRSHAQKFFSKVIRESASRTADSVKPIEIPPPRPKKKPMHPYPRKLGCAPNKELPVLKKLERSPSPIESVSDQDNKSPTSVLSAIGSDMMGSSASNTPTRCLSSESFATGSNLAISVLTEQEKGSPSPRSASRVLNLDDKSPMEADYTCANENPMVEAPVTSLKLFGRTVLVTDAHKSSSSVTDSVKQCDKLLPPTSDENSKEDEERDEQTSVLSPSEEATQRNFCGISGEGLYNGWPGGMHPMFYCLPFQQENNASSSTTAPIPWWVFYGLPFPVVHPSHLSLQQHPPGNSKELQKEGSESGSNVASEGEAEAVKNKGDDGEEAQEPQLKIYGEKSTSISQKSGSQRKGFVPYKRCLSEKEGKKSDVSEDEDDRRRNPLCL